MGAGDHASRLGGPAPRTVGLNIRASRPLHAFLGIFRKGTKVEKVGSWIRRITGVWGPLPCRSRDLRGFLALSNVRTIMMLCIFCP